MICFACATFVSLRRTKCGKIDYLPGGVKYYYLWSLVTSDRGNYRYCNKISEDYDHS